MGLQLETISWEVPTKFSKMVKFFVASVLSLGLASAAPQVPLAAAPLALPLAPNCKVEDVVIETQACTPRSETVCNTIDVTHQHVEYEQICEDFTSTHCPAAPAHLIKREADAEADPQYFAAPDTDTPDSDTPTLLWPHPSPQLSPPSNTLAMR